MADPSDYDYQIPKAYIEDTPETMKAYDQAHLKAGRALIGDVVKGPDGKPISNFRGTLHRTDDGREFWVPNTSPSGRFFKTRLQTGPLSIPNATPEEVSPNDQGPILKKYQEELTNQPFNPFLKSANNPHPSWYVDAKGNEIPATLMSPSQLRNAHQILETFNSYKNKDASGVQNFFNENATAIQTLDKIKALMSNTKVLGNDPIGTLQYYANGALNWSKLSNTQKAGYPDGDKLALANELITRIQQARDQIAGMDAASAQDKGSNLGGLAHSALETISEWLPGKWGTPLRVAGGASGELPAGADITKVAAVIDGMEKQFKQAGVKDMMADTSTYDYPINPQLREQYHQYGLDLYKQGIKYGDSPLDHTDNLNVTLAPPKPKPTPTGPTTGETTTGIAPGYTPAQWMALTLEERQAALKKAQIDQGGDKGGEPNKPATGTGASQPTGPTGQQWTPSTTESGVVPIPAAAGATKAETPQPNAPVNVSGMPSSDWNVRPTPAVAQTSNEPAQTTPGQVEPTNRIGESAGGAALRNIGHFIGKDWNKVNQWLDTLEGHGPKKAPIAPAPANQGPETVGNASPSDPLQSPLEKALGNRPAPLVPPAGTPAKPAAQPWGWLQWMFGGPKTSQNQLPSNAEMGAPLGSPDNPIMHQEHVDALEPGTPFHWRDHPAPYVKV